MTAGCFHCGQPLPAGTPRQVAIQGQLQPVCCAGCEMAAQWIQSAGLGAYYRWRTGPATAPDESANHAEFLAYDRTQAQQSSVMALPDGNR